MEYYLSNAGISLFVESDRGVVNRVLLSIQSNKRLVLSKVYKSKLLFNNDRSTTIKGFSSLIGIGFCNGFEYITAEFGCDGGDCDLPCFCKYCNDCVTRFEIH